MLTSAPCLAQANLMQHVNSYPLFAVGGLSVTNHILMMLVAAFLMIVVFAHVGRRARNPVPSGLANFFESILSFLRTEVFRPALGANTDRFAPFLWTVFFFILFCNLLGMVPTGAILGLFNGNLMHWGGAATGNMSVTAGLALCAFAAIHVSGIIQNVRVQMDPTLDPHHTGRDHMPPHGHGGTLGATGPDAERDVTIDHHVGDGHDDAHGLHHAPAGKPFLQAVPAGIGVYIWTYAPHPEIGNKVLDVGMWVVLLLLEGIGTLVKPFSLCVRLFANMLAGHLVLAALVGLVPLTAGIAWMLGISIPVVLGSAALSVLELFVAFLQAYIFVFLTTLFIASAVAPEH
jgi:F-type H+-transporting ATPase subunit a